MTTSTPRPAVTITHTAADGTLLDGTVKGDGVWETIKAAQATHKIRGWRYMPSIRAIGMSHSRDKPPQLRMIDRTAELLRQAGFDVTTEVDATPRPIAEAEADRAERMDERADRLGARAERKAGESDARYTASQELIEHIPPGQPILVGHHSERGHRRILQRSDDLMRASLALEEEAKRDADAARSAQRHMDLREAPGRVARRIITLTADRGRAQRALDGNTRNHRRHDGTIYHQSITPPATGTGRAQHLLDLAHLDEQITYWGAILDEHRAAGRYNPLDLATVKPGDWVKTWGGWETVVKVNRTTITVKRDPGWDNKVKVGDITEHRTAAQVDAEQARAVAAADAAITAEQIALAEEAATP